VTLLGELYEGFNIKSPHQAAMSSSKITLFTKTVKRLLKPINHNKDLPKLWIYLTSTIPSLLPFDRKGLGSSLS